MRSQPWELRASPKAYIRARVRMGPNGQKPGPARGRTASKRPRRPDRRKRPKSWTGFVAADAKGWSLASSLVRPWPACLPPKTQARAHISPPLRATHGPAIWERVDAGHRRRAASGAEAEVEAPRCFRRVVAESEDAAAGAVVLSPSRHLPPFAAAPFPPEIMVDSDDEYYFKNFIDTSFPCTGGPCRAARPPWTAKENDQLYRDYFQPKAIFVPPLFRRRFRMTRPLFRRIMDGVKIYDDYFRAKVDALGKVGLSSYQKCTTAIRMLAYGVAGDFVDEYTRMSESTALESMYRFCRAVIGSFGEQYLRQPNAEDTARLLSINAARGFPGMLGSIDCMHWEWKNCPFGWQGAYSGHSEGCTVILEAVASHDTWIWHSFFGMAGSHNDINVLQRSPVFDRLAYGQSPDVDFEINGHHYTKGYYLADGIYPPWATLVKTIRKPNSEQEARFAKEQEAARKDVERAFGILQARWAIVRHPARAWDVQTLWEVMTACVIMHNMIVEKARGKRKRSCLGANPISSEQRRRKEWKGQGLPLHQVPAEETLPHVGGQPGVDDEEDEEEEMILRQDILQQPHFGRIAEMMTRREEEKQASGETADGELLGLVARQLLTSGD
ncbi:hypothetical protein QYE76_066316 [Lolium multiflorum]|uniref:Uncharacterized protein n=1 Tax=Lolium multiflorum TaxID=4521 RepID=A0AAD8W9N2_LOLMU|nr:hypothetical protein QYE76_066316 [Lolium multiflorum]